MLFLLFEMGLELSFDRLKARAPGLVQLLTMKQAFLCSAEIRRNV